MLDHPNPMVRWWAYATLMWSNAVTETGIAWCKLGKQAVGNYNLALCRPQRQPVVIRAYEPEQSKIPIAA
mgnify:FL=1